MMNKVIAVLMALVLALSCTAALAEDASQGSPAPDPDRFSGIWQCDRASIRIDWEEEGYRVFIEWASSAWENTEWEYSCYLHEEDNTLVSMPCGIRTDLVYTEGSDDPQATVAYEDGSAVFSLDAEGKLIWQDHKENAGEGMRFVWTGDGKIDVDAGLPLDADS